MGFLLVLTWNAQTGDSAVTPGKTRWVCIIILLHTAILFPLSPGLVTCWVLLWVLWILRSCQCGYEHAWCLNCPVYWPRSCIPCRLRSGRRSWAQSLRYELLQWQTRVLIQVDWNAHLVDFYFMISVFQDKTTNSSAHLLFVLPTGWAVGSDKQRGRLCTLPDPAPRACSPPADPPGDHNNMS